jgi:uncharacterized membrane protein
MWRRVDVVLPTFRRNTGLLTPALTVSSFADFLIFLSTMKMEAIRTSDTSVNTTFKRRHIPEDCFLHSHRRENLKSYT